MILSLIGVANVMWFDATSYLAAFVLIALFVRVVREVHDPAASGGL